MTSQGLTIREAADALGVSEKTIRRRIKGGSIKAHQVQGAYYITDLGAVDSPEDSIPDPGPDTNALANSPVGHGPSPGLDSTLDKALDMIRSLQAENEKLARQLGFLQAKLLESENRLLLLSAPSRPWWSRLLWWRRGVRDSSGA